MEKTIIYNELPLTETFIPTRLLHREGQLREIERCLNPLLKERIPENVFLLGPTGTGKTITAKWILENHFHNKFVYINCWKYRRTHQILKEILLSFEIPVHGREPTSELIKTLDLFLQRKGKLIFCLDEVDQLKDFDILYILARRECCLILISNDHKALTNVDPRIKSRLALTEIEFPAYKPKEIFDILKDRVNYSFKPGTLPEILIKIASRVAKGDARIALEIVRRAGRKAEEKGLRKVTMKEMREALKEVRKLKKSYLLSKLNEHQRIIYQVIEEKRKINSGKLYKEYCKRVKKPVSERMYRNYMKKMVKLGLIEKKGYGRWRKYEILI